MYILKPEMAEDLRNTNREIYQDSPEFLEETDYIATIGDICTLKIFKDVREPNLSIVDLKTKRNIPLEAEDRKIMSNIGSRTIEVDNPPGTISLEMWKAIENNVGHDVSIKIVVNGEEDLATLAVISMVKLGAKVIYGMPDRGMVIVDVNQQEKKRANSFLKHMLVN